MLQGRRDWGKDLTLQMITGPESCSEPPWGSTATRTRSWDLPCHLLCKLGFPSPLLLLIQSLHLTPTARLRATHAEGIKQQPERRGSLGGGGPQVLGKTKSQTRWQCPQLSEEPMTRGVAELPGHQVYVQHGTGCPLSFRTEPLLREPPTAQGGGAVSPLNTITHWIPERFCHTSQKGPHTLRCDSPPTGDLQLSS